MLTNTIGDTLLLSGLVQCEHASILCECTITRMYVHTYILYVWTVVRTVTQARTHTHICTATCPSMSGTGVFIKSIYINSTIARGGIHKHIIYVVHCFMFCIAYN